MYVDNSWLSLLHPHEFSDMDGFQDGGYIWVTILSKYHEFASFSRGRIMNRTEMIAILAMVYVEGRWGRWDMYVASWAASGFYRPLLRQVI